MMQNHIHPKDLPVLNPDLALVQRVFDAVRAEAGAKTGDQYSNLIASTLVHFYKQGVRKEARLLEMLRQSAPMSGEKGRSLQSTHRPPKLGNTKEKPMKLSKPGTVAVILCGLAILSSCGNTIRGMGRDTANTVDATQNAGKRVGNAAAN